MKVMDDPILTTTLEEAEAELDIRVISRRSCRTTCVVSRKAGALSRMLSLSYLINSTTLGRTASTETNSRDQKACSPNRTRCQVNKPSLGLSVITRQATALSTLITVGVMMIEGTTTMDQEEFTTVLAVVLTIKGNSSPLKGAIAGGVKATTTVSVDIEVAATIQGINTTTTSIMIIRAMAEVEDQAMEEATQTTISNTSTSITVATGEEETGTEANTPGNMNEYINNVQ